MHGAKPKWCLMPALYCVAYLIESLEAIWDSYPDDYNPDLLKG